MSSQTVPLPDYPRPEFVRRDWMNLNGWWSFAFDADGVGESSGWFTRLPGDSGRILIPYVHQCPLSGVDDPAQVDYVWYARAFRIPDSWQGRRTLLHFGAVDYQADIWVNGTYAGGHRGGFTSFALDITPHIHFGDNQITLRAFDPVSPDIPSGKQTPTQPEGCLYTRSTGIWQTVWLEAVPEDHMDAPLVHSSLLDKAFTANVPISTLQDGLRVRVQLSHSGTHLGTAESVVEGQTAHVQLAVPQAPAWMTGDPQLVDMHYSLLARDGSVLDEAWGYTGFRDISISGDTLLLNGRLLIVRGVLDQGYYPGGLYTPESSEVIWQDIHRTRALGFNTARFHQKVFPPLAFYWADRLGLLVWAEAPDWGLDLKLPAARENFQREWQEIIRRDISHPCIVAWTPFNERSGEYMSDPTQINYVRSIVELTHQIDPTRPVVSSSGYGHVTQTDIADIHEYSHDSGFIQAAYCTPGFGSEEPACSHGNPVFAPGEVYRGQPVIASEIGGIWWNPDAPEAAQHWGYGDRPRTEEEFLKRYRETIQAFLDSPRLSGFVYTQLTDVEQETNGLFSLQRRLKFPLETLRQINQSPSARQ